MKQLFLLNILIALLSAPVHAETIKVFATDVTSSFGGFSASPGGAALANDAQIQSVISNDATAAIFGTSSTNYSAIDLGFGDNNVVTGAGADLVIFSLWYGNDYAFGLQAFGAGDAINPISNFNYNVLETSIFSEDCAITDRAGGCTAYIAATSIDLFGSDGFALDDDINVDFIRLFFGGSFYNGDVDAAGFNAYSNISLVGANYTDAMVVPLPLSVVLFGSGLTLLGLFGRRKTR